MAKETILIVDDEAAHSELIAFMVRRKLGVEAIEVANAERAIELAHSEQPALIVLDVMLPGLVGGFDVLWELRADPETTHIPILMLTASAKYPEFRIRAMEQGATAFMGKPFDTMKLIEQITTLLQARQRKAEEISVASEGPYACLPDFLEQPRREAIVQ